MPIYIYKAVTRNGQVVRNRVEESNKYILLRRLKKNDLTPIAVTQINAKIKNSKKQKRNIETNSSVLKSIRYNEIQKELQSKNGKFKKRIHDAIYKNQRVTKKDIAIFTENFYLLKKANFNNIHALSTLINTTENMTLKNILEDILIGVEAGENMYTTMEYYEGVFPPIYINMIKVGELSGSLTNSLQQAVEYLEDTTTRSKKIKKILIPNLLQFIGIFLLLIGGTIFILPEIQKVFASIGQGTTLPGPTLWFMNLVDNFGKIWYIPVAIIGAILLLIMGYINTPKGKYNWHYFKYKAPVFGRLVFGIDFSRLMRAMLLNLRNGMRIQEALEVSKSVIKNYVLLSIVETSINNILIGASWIEPFEKSGLCSAMEVEMLKIGMQTDLPDMMEKLLDYMDVDIQNSLSKIMKVLPEISYLFVGTLIIFLVVVLLVPCINLYMGGFMLDGLDI